MQSSPAPAPTTHDAKIKSVSVWFYIIAAFQFVVAYLAWSGSDSVAGAVGMALAVSDVIIGALFVVLGYYAGKRQPWAFAAGLVLYALRAVLQFVQSFNPISLAIRAFLLFRIWQGLQACIAANDASRALALMNQRRLVMPQAAPTTQPAAPPPPAWSPSRPVAQPSASE